MCPRAAGSILVARPGQDCLSPALSPWWMLQSCPLGCPQTLLPPAPALDSGTSRRADLDVLFWSSPTKADWRMLLVGGHQSHPAQPLWEAVAVHGVGSLRTGGEGAPACRVGGVGEAGRRGCAWGGGWGRPLPGTLATLPYRPSSSTSSSRRPSCSTHPSSSR